MFGGAHAKHPPRQGYPRSPNSPEQSHPLLVSPSSPYQPGNGAQSHYARSSPSPSTPHSDRAASPSPFQPDMNSASSSSSHSYHRQPVANPFAESQSNAPSVTGSTESYVNVVPGGSQSTAEALYRKNQQDKESIMRWNAGPEEDDDLHNPDVPEPRGIGTLFTCRGLANLGCLFLLVVILVVLFAGYPIIQELTTKPLSSNGGFNLGGVNASGQLPDLGAFSLIDKDTPAEAYYHTSLETGEQWELVFSDEFDRPGRTFYPGDDPYWEAVDLHYWGTNNKEWYDPRNLYTRDGHLVIEFNDKQVHGMNYSGGMMSTWNRFCFTGGYIETAISLPGNTLVAGLWPAAWTMGNLGRAGYGGSLDGLWPYTYDSCDEGTLKNQTLNGLPKLTVEEGSEYHDGALSYLPGQRLSRCTCPDDRHHPGPKHPDGTFVGRASPEIDIIEAAVDPAHIPDGQVSLSAQWAPFNPGYECINTTQTTNLFLPKEGYYNSYKGAVYQQATSVLGYTNQDCYTNNTGCFSKYGFEYATGDDGYITWVSTGKKIWQIRQTAMAPNERAKVGQRLVSVEPMYIILNLGLSENFGFVDYEGLQALLPVAMHVDYVRVYQDPSKRNIGCDPPDFPTSKYIESLKPAYSNPNITTFDQLAEEVPGLKLPGNSLLGQCS